ncbi:MAG: hypothetical protein U0175_35900 [Caldilineaceae bacterium]
MVGLPTIDKVDGLAQLGNVVPDGYSYYQKWVMPREDLHLSSAYLKWYDIYPAEVAITADEFVECRTFVTNEATRIPFEGDLGFVMLHRAGAALLLLITTWRNTNEMWEAVYWKLAGSMDAYQHVHFPTEHRGTYCVWELAVVWHERHAWVRFISSKRDPEAKLAYINDRFSGLV